MLTLCRIDDIADPGSKGFKFQEKSIFAVRQRGEVYVYRNRCPHIGIELNWQEDQFLDFDDSLIQCSTHGALFIIESGECIAGPCHGKALEQISSKLEDGNIILTGEF
ncbi:Rieske (2Fe-2S) protein [Zhongshania sp. BJYM1]|mgnify:CR=1 FL=1|jgi:nitrite reductase/ring-hydroxylating ferredoxin subunit|uniref:Rieske (2Fe-2S) protein n=1 Tax=Zhongshania aquatica TaxID=2965069 RepID=UPI0022B3590E|nr:Rieske (2Fe-2S) protein [Marortus sp. BJYM1]